MIDEKTQQQLMDYLFDEMDSSERTAFEKKLRENDELRQKFNELKSTRSLIGNYAAEIPERDFAKEGDATKSHPAIEKQSSGLMRYSLMAVAATFLIAMFFVLFQTVQIGQTDDGYFLAFGTPPVQSVSEGISEDEINQIIDQLRTENALLMNAMIERVQQEQNAQFNESLTVLADYYEDRRNRDLILFTEGLLQLEENTATRINRTNQALNGIIYALSNE